MAQSKFPNVNDSDASRLLASGIRYLRFPEPLESEFRAEHRARLRPWNRLSFWIAACTVTGFAVIDHFVLHGEHPAITNMVRFGVQVPAVILMLIFTSKQFYERWYGITSSIILPLFGAGTVVMAAFSPPHEAALISGRLMLAAFFFYFMVGLRLREALRVNALVFAALVTAIGFDMLRQDIAAYMLFTLLCANIIGFVGSYALEHANRTAFLEHRQLTEVATHDGLTALLNRAAFEDQIRRVWQQAQRDRQTVAIIMIDIDYFKAFNDRYGHLAGDDCLRRVSVALRDAARRRPLDFVARYGGEELIAVLYGADRAYGESIARSLLSVVRDLRIPHDSSQAQPYVTISVGVVSVDAYRMASHDSAVAMADQALYEAKNHGRDRHVSADPAARTDATANLPGSLKEASGS